MEAFQIDFHQYTVEDAVRVVEGMVNQARLNQEPVYCQFITGKGRIQKELIRILTEIYDLSPIIPLYNRGLILVEIC